MQQEEILQQDGDLSRSHRRKAAAAQVRGWRMWYSRRKSCSRTGISAEANLSVGRRSQQEPISQQGGMGGGSGKRGGWDGAASCKSLRYLRSICAVSNSLVL